MVIEIDTTNQGDNMTKQFNMDEFNSWVQDTQDYSMIEDKDVYIERRSNDAFTYCTTVLGMIPISAWCKANLVHIKDSERLK